MGLAIFQPNASALDQDPQDISVLHLQVCNIGSRSSWLLWMCNDCINLCIYRIHLCIYDQMGSVIGSKVIGKTLIQ